MPPLAIVACARNGTIGIARFDHETLGSSKE